MTLARASLRCVAVAVGALALWLIWTAWPQSLGGRVAYVRVDGWSMNPTLHNGDLAVVRRQPSYRVGDVVAYRIPRGEFGAGALVVHRLVGGNGARGFLTRGDNRTINDSWHPRTTDVVGRVRFDMPGAGKTFATASQPVWIGGLVALTTVLVMVLPVRERTGGRRRRHPNGRVRRHHVKDHVNRPTFPSSSSRDLPIPPITDKSPSQKAVV